MVILYAWDRLHLSHTSAAESLHLLTFFQNPTLLKIQHADKRIRNVHLHTDRQIETLKCAYIPVVSHSSLLGSFTWVGQCPSCILSKCTVSFRTISLPEIYRFQWCFRFLFLSASAGEIPQQLKPCKALAGGPSLLPAPMLPHNHL